jgi:hypothetical protein
MVISHAEIVFVRLPASISLGGGPWLHTKSGIEYAKSIGTLQVRAPSKFLKVLEYHLEYRPEISYVL